jgi:hypothetical protein
VQLACVISARPRWHAMSVHAHTTASWLRLCTCHAVPTGRRTRCNANSQPQSACGDGDELELACAVDGQVRSCHERHSVGAAVLRGRTEKPSTPAIPKKPAPNLIAILTAGLGRSAGRFATRAHWGSRCRTGQTACLRRSARLAPPTVRVLHLCFYRRVVVRRRRIRRAACLTSTSVCLLRASDKAVQN